MLGNPIWPFGGGKYIDPTILQFSLNQLNNLSKKSGFNYQSFEELVKSFRRLFLFYVDFNNASLYHGLNPAFLFLALPGVVLSFLKRCKKLRFFVCWFLILLSTYIAFLGYNTRYLILISIPTVFISIYTIKSLLNYKIGKLLVLSFLIVFYTFSLSFFCMG